MCLCYYIILTISKDILMSGFYIFPLFHPIQVNDVFVLLSGQAASYVIIYIIFLLPLWLAAIGIMLSYLPKTGGRETALLLLLVGLYFILPPLWSFAIYFCCVHSLRHFVVLNTQIEGGLVKSGHLRQIALFSVLPIALIVIFALQAQFWGNVYVQVRTLCCKMIYEF